MRQILTLIQRSLLILTVVYVANKSHDVKVIIAGPGQDVAVKSNDIKDVIREPGSDPSGSFERTLARASDVQSKLFSISTK